MTPATAPVLFAATGDAATGDGGALDAAGDLLSRFGVSVPSLLVSLLNFALVALALYFLAVRPVLRALDARNAKIEAGLRDAEAAARKLADAERECRERLAAAAGEGAKIVGEAGERAKALAEKIAKDAAAEAAALLERARAQTERDRDGMLAELRAETARLVVETTAKVLRRELGDAERARLAAAAAGEIAGAAA
ncbi:MAG: F0F1 ATP synthase subunit B [Puniceicoccales bacterium]|jgi:F-type H+-transporting ATPase subunit b|nr:F0F1 ATP synthase subunit B [Puniceicoccales bacterium]